MYHSAVLTICMTYKGFYVFGTTLCSMYDIYSGTNTKYTVVHYYQPSSAEPLGSSYCFVVCLLSVVCLSVVSNTFCCCCSTQTKKTERTRGPQNNLVCLNIYWVLSHIVRLTLVRSAHNSICGLVLFNKLKREGIKNIIFFWYLQNLCDPHPPPQICLTLP